LLVRHSQKGDGGKSSALGGNRILILLALSLFEVEKDVF